LVRLLERLGDQVVLGLGLLRLGFGGGLTSGTGGAPVAALISWPPVRDRSSGRLPLGDLLDHGLCRRGLASRAPAVIATARKRK